MREHLDNAVARTLHPICPRCGGRMGVDLGGNPYHVGPACEVVAEVTAEQLAERDHHDLLLAIAENSGDQAEVLDHLRAIHQWAMEVVAHG